MSAKSSSLVMRPVKPTLASLTSPVISKNDLSFSSSQQASVLGGLQKVGFLLHEHVHRFSGLRLLPGVSPALFRSLAVSLHRLRVEVTFSDLPLRLMNRYTWTLMIDAQGCK